MEFCPGIYEHAAAIIGRSPWEVSRSADLLAAAHVAAWRRYGQRLVVVGIDVYNVEAEALGAIVPKPSGHGVPALASHPLQDMEELAELPPFDPSAGRWPTVIEAALRLADACRGAEVLVPLCGPMALAQGLLGMENLLMGLHEDAEAAAGALAALADRQVAALRSIVPTGANPIFF